MTIHRLTSRLGAHHCAILLALLSFAPSLAPAQAPGAGWTVVELRAAVHGLSDGFSSWNEQEGRIEHRASARTGLGLSASRLWRFGEQDRRYAVDGSFAAGSRLTLGMEAEGSPTHRLSARTGGRGWASVTLGGGWVMQLSALERRYGSGSGDVRLRAASAALERYVGNWYASYSYTAGRAIEDGPMASHQGRLTRFWGRRSSISASFATGTEAENLGWRGIQVMDVRSGALWGDIPLGSHLSITYAGGMTRQGSLYVRRTLSLGMRARTN